MGRSQTPIATASTETGATATGRRTAGTETRIGGGASSSFMGSKELRQKLDEESNPLKRFSLALENMEAWVDRDPRGALAWLSTQQRSERRDDVIRMALAQYSRTDPPGAAGWAVQNLSGTELNNTLIAIAENWAEENGKDAATWFAKLPATMERDAAIEGMMFAWASNEPQAALDFINSHPDLSQLTPTMLRAALAGWAKTEPEAAVAASLSISRTRNDHDQFANTLANWATMDLEASSAWMLSNLQAGAERTAAAGELASIYANQSPDSGIQWLAKLSSGAERDTAASAFAAAWARHSPEEAAKWATNYQGNLSPDTMASISRTYLMKNREAFEAWRNALPPGPLKEQAASAGAVSESDD